MRDHVGIEAQDGDIAFDQLQNRPGRHRRVGKAIPAHAACRAGGGKQRPGRVVGDAGHGQPGGQPLDGFQVQRRGAFLAALAGDVQDAVLAGGLEIADAKPDQFADAAAGVGQHRQHGPVADTRREAEFPLQVLDLRCFQQAAAIVRREAHRFAIA
jgi:hypothetical protein